MRATVPLPASRAFAQRPLQTTVRSPVPRIATQTVRTTQQAQAAITERRGEEKEVVTSPRPVQPTSSWPSLRTLDGLTNAGGCPGARYGHSYSATAPPVSSSVSPIACSSRPASMHVLPGPPGTTSLACAASVYSPAQLGSCSACPGAQSNSQVQATVGAPLPLRPQPNHEWRWATSPSGEAYMADLPGECALTHNSSAPNLAAPDQEDHAPANIGQCNFAAPEPPLQHVPGRSFPMPTSDASLSPRRADQNVPQSNQLQPLHKQSQSLDRSRQVDSPKRQNRQQQQLARSPCACKPNGRKEAPGRMPNGIPGMTASPRGSRQAALAANGSIAKPSTLTASTCLSQQPAPALPSARSSHCPLSWASDDWTSTGCVRSPRDDRATSGFVATRNGSHNGLDAHEATRTSVQHGDDVAGMRDSRAMALQQMKQELEQLRFENAQLKDELTEVRSERDREHMRAESLQKSSQKLLWQLERETSRVHELEQQLASVGRCEVKENGGLLPLDAPQLDGFVDYEGEANDECLAAPQHGSVSAPRHSDECLAAQELQRSPTTLAAPQHGSLAASQHGSLAAPQHGSLAAPQHGSLAAPQHGSMSSSSEAAAELDHPGGSEAMQSLGPGSQPLNTTVRLPESGITGSELQASSNEMQQNSWEFVVQGQHDSDLQQSDFAPKTLSCYPDDAVHKALVRRGVACVCSRGRRLDRSVPNQDDFVAARHTLALGGHIALYGVFDGHGPAGHHCAAFARGAIPESLFGQRTLLLRPEDTLREAFRQTQVNLLKQHFDTAHSGTTACIALVLNLPAAQSDGTQISESWLFVAHVGDSRAILASRKGSDTSAFTVTALTKDHRPDEVDEADRVRKHGGEIRKLRDNSGASRVFMKGQDRPALALTRTLGASAASECGVTSEPDISAYRLRPGVDVLLVLGTDGLFEFCSNHNAAAQILKEGVTEAVVSSLCRASRRQWAQGSYNETVDDITAIAAMLHSDVASLDK